jgi:dCMP deaminase
MRPDYEARKGKTGKDRHGFERPGWDDYFMGIAKAVRARANCTSAPKGAVIVKDKRIISTGYNGTPRGIKNCNEGGCKRCADRTIETSGQKLDECTCCHAEENAIVHAALHGISTKGGTLYTTFTPCLTCAKMIINAGIERVVAGVEYPAGTALNLLKEAGIELDRLDIQEENI